MPFNMVAAIDAEIARHENEIKILRKKRADVLASDAEQGPRSHSSIRRDAILALSDHLVPALHFAPDIPEKKLLGALDSYGEGIAVEDVLVLVDDTVFGGAKEGFLITSEVIAAKQLMVSAVRFRLGKVRNIRIEKSKLLVNGSVVSTLTQLNEKKLGRFVGALNAVLNNVLSEPIAEPRQIPTLITELPVAVLPLRIDAGRIATVEASTSAEAMAQATLLQTAPSGEIAGAVEPSRIWGALSQAIDANRHGILPLLKENLGGLSMRAIRDDENVIKLAAGLYPMLPTVLRFAVKEPVFIDFVMKNRDVVLDKLMPEKFEENSFALNSAAVPAQIPLPATERQRPMVTVELTLAAEPLLADVGVVDTIENLAGTVEPTPLGVLQLSPSSSDLAGLAPEVPANSKILSFLSQAIEANRHKIVPLLKEKLGEASLQALRNDDNIRKLAVGLYPLLPTVVRFAVKEPIFIGFVMENRDKVLDKLMPVGMETAPSVLKRDVVSDQVPLLASSPDVSGSAEVRLAPRAISAPLESEVEGEPGYFFSAIQDSTSGSLEKFRARHERLPQNIINSLAYRRELENYRMKSLAYDFVGIGITFPQYISSRIDGLSLVETDLFSRDRTAFEVMAYAMALLQQKMTGSTAYGTERAERICAFIASVVLLPFAAFLDGADNEGTSEAKSETSSWKHFQQRSRGYGDLLNEDQGLVPAIFARALGRQLESCFQTPSASVHYFFLFRENNHSVLTEFFDGMDSAFENMLAKHAEA